MPGELDVLELLADSVNVVQQLTAEAAANDLWSAENTAQTVQELTAEAAEVDV